ncbi:hypothetical protein J7M23_04355 [Candidatus Sumerlaeota bacterium]|nr:hypothetical protein [Candidatus Sumerlaeota bacterium]
MIASKIIRWVFRFLKKDIYRTYRDAKSLIEFITPWRRKYREERIMTCKQSLLSTAALIEMSKEIETLQRNQKDLLMNLLQSDDAIASISRNINLLLEEMRKSREPEPIIKGYHNYVMGSAFIYDCYKLATKAPEENLFFATGVELDGRIILNKILPLQLSVSTFVRVVGDICSVAEALESMEMFNHRFFCYFHNHPGSGPGATFPSGIDKAMQERVERGGYPAVGGIFSADGYLRFFSLKNKFKIEIFGKGMRQIAENLYKLEFVKKISLRVPQTEISWRSRGR